MRQSLLVEIGLAPFVGKGKRNPETGRIQIVSDLELRVKKLEALVKALCKVAGVVTAACKHPQCELSGGFWQDGSECGHCDGTQFIILPTAGGYDKAPRIETSEGPIRH